MIWLNGHELDFQTFPNGETLVDGKEIYRFFNGTITFKYENDSDLIKLMFVKKYLDERQHETNLKILYMPYSRMDRVEGYSVFTLKYVSQFINSLGFNNIEVYEPHSDVSMALLDNSKARYPTVNLINSVVKEINFSDEDYVYYPDAGAEKRYTKHLKFKNQLVGLKQRDFETGNIKKLQVIGDVKEPGFKVLMIDDLCSKGGTFIMGAKQLKELGASDIYLLITHCEPNIYNGEILTTDLITKVFTTNSMIEEPCHPKIKIYNLGGTIINE